MRRRRLLTFTLFGLFFFRTRILTVEVAEVEVEQKFFTARVYCPRILMCLRVREGSDALPGGPDEKTRLHGCATEFHLSP